MGKILFGELVAEGEEYWKDAEGIRRNKDAYLLFMRGVGAACRQSLPILYSDAVVDPGFWKHVSASFEVL